MLSVCGVLADHRGVVGYGCVNVEEGIIRSITKLPRGERVLDYRTGALLLPGFVDLHVHLRGLQLAYKEDELSGTAAAAASGVTLVVDMPNTVPRLSSPEAVLLKLEALRAASIVDYAVYAGIPDREEDVDKMLELPIAGFKVYPEDLEMRLEPLRKVLLSGSLVVVHAELPEAEKAELCTGRCRDAHRGCHWEVAAVDTIMAQERRARLHVTHASCPDTVELAKRRGATVDVTPHHLLLDPGEECTLTVNPPLRSAVARMGLLKQLLEGLVDALASDHAPHTSSEKLWPLCKPGISWLEAWPQLVYCLVRAGALTLGEYVELVARGPSKILSLEGIYGTLSPGARANIVVVREHLGRYVYKGISRGANRPYHLARTCMTVVATFVGGELVYSEGSVLERPRAVNPFQSGLQRR